MTGFLRGFMAGKISPTLDRGGRSWWRVEKTGGDLMLRLPHAWHFGPRHLSAESGAVGRQPNDLAPFNGRLSQPRLPISPLSLRLPWDGPVPIFPSFSTLLILFLTSSSLAIVINAIFSKYFFTASNQALAYSRVLCYNVAWIWPEPLPFNFLLPTTWMLFAHREHFNI